jgi:hypothetical protein
LSYAFGAPRRMVHSAARPGREVPSMFSTLRAVIIIGVIFYLSPVRQGAERPARVDEMVKWGQDTLATGASVPLDKAAQLQSLWQALPDSAKKSITDQASNSSTGRPGSPLPATTDTLTPGDLQPHWRGGDARKTH